MKDYVIFTDSACDISPEILSEWGVPCVSLTFHFEGEDKEYSNGEMPVKDFYDRMREGGIAKTSAVNSEIFYEAFEKVVKEGKDLLYIGFSSGLSATYSAAKIASEELMKAYPESKVLTVDSLAASAGFGLLLYLTLEEKKKGAGIEEAAAFAENMKLKICHWFTVDDLKYLKRGGRVSPAVALVGTVLGIKPVLHVDNDGHLIKKTTVRGRKASISALADKFAELADNTAGGTVYISHGDCAEDVKLLEDIFKERFGIKIDIVTYVGPVIGAHAGPGVIALFFVGKER
ncbi:MAG: DegV family protein [Clostridia bacterium]|nr:DegV family protein [Clostridia bacterium]